jgi:transcriptional regulator with AAA-type ATPase domain/tetratricopeptide (TPR) repeat protein
MTPLARLVGECPRITALAERVRRLLGRGTRTHVLPPVLIEGETGTGKGLLARLLHDAGPRSGGPFVSVNCAAIPGPLLEAELFGFERGAFTDARQAKPGLFEAAHNGTIFLDEVGLLPEGLQAKLLKVVEDRQVRRLGSVRSEPLDVWILAATSNDLAAPDRAPRFHEALYHRLSVVTLRLPPLRERERDVLLLAGLFLGRACAEYGLPRRRLGAAAEAALLRHAWPGNVRELANVIERAVLLSEEPVVTAEALGLDPPSPAPRAGLEDESAALVEALRQTRGNVSRAAARLGISRDSMRYRMRKHRVGGAGSGLRRRAGHAAEPEGPARPAPGAIRWEQRPLALVRVALAGATPPGLDLVVEKLRSLGGRIEELSPTAAVAAFGLDAPEDGPLRAAVAALAVQAAARRRPTAGGGDADVRAAIHTGRFLVDQGGGSRAIDAEARRQACDLLGRLTDAAQADAILVSEAGSRLLRRRFRLTPWGEVPAVAGAVYRLARRGETDGPPAGRPATFVGRRQEVELLRSRLATAVAGRGQIVIVAGEPGIGKSRLVRELTATVSDGAAAPIELRCVPYGRAIPFLPWLGALRDHWGLADGDGPDAVAAKVRAGLARAGVEAEPALPVLFHLLDQAEAAGPLAVLSPEALRARTFEVLLDLVVRSSRRRPLLLVVEDLQWIDRTTEEWLEALVERVPAVPLLLVATGRPGYRPVWADRSDVTQLALPALGAQDSRRLLRSLPGASTLPAAVAELILARAEGNPFFLEELALAVASAGGDTPPAIPDSVRGVLLARIDRLPDEARRLLRVAAVLGREPTETLLRALWDGPIDPVVHDLSRLEFLCASSATDEPGYAFKHALTQEVAYESLPDAERRALHEGAACALERLHAGRLDEIVDRLAFHYARSERNDRAVDCLVRLAERASRRHAHAEAVDALEDALRHAARLAGATRERRTVEVALRLADSFYYLGRLPQSLEVLRAQEAPVAHLADPRLGGPFHLLLGRTLRLLGDRAGGVQALHRALAAASGCGDRPTEGKAYAVLAMEGYWAGDPRQGVEHGRRAAALLEATDERWWLGQTHWTVGCNYVFMGEFEAALEALGRAAAVGASLGDPRLRAYATWTRGLVLALSGEADAGIDACRQGVELATDPLARTQALGMLGAGYLEKGVAAGAIPALEQAVGELQRYRSQVRAWYTAWLGEAYLLAGRTREARETLETCLDIAGQVSFRFALGLATRALGRLDLAGGEPASAGRRLHEALGTFEAIHARFEAGRTRLDLAGLARAGGDPGGAAAHLEEAGRAFRALRVPRYVQRVERLAAEVGTV